MNYAFVSGRGISRTFPGRERVVALSEVDLDIPASCRAALVGPSGSGKTTLLNVIGCLQAADTGTLSVDNQRIDLLDDLGRAVFRKAKLGFIFQNFELMPDRSVRENVAMGLLYTDVSRTDRLRRADQILERMAMSHRAKSHARTLSGGEQQRVAIGRALVSRPRLLLADEPTGNLDADSAERILQTIDELVEAEGLTVITATHDPRVAERADLVIRLGHGRVQAAGS